MKTRYGNGTTENAGDLFHIDCGGEVYSFKEGIICNRCNANEDVAETRSLGELLDEIESTFDEILCVPATPDGGLGYDLRCSTDALVKKIRAYRNARDL